MLGIPLYTIYIIPCTPQARFPPIFLNMHNIRETYKNDSLGRPVYSIFKMKLIMSNQTFILIAGCFMPKNQIFVIFRSTSGLG